MHGHRRALLFKCEPIALNSKLIYVSNPNPTPNPGLHLPFALTALTHRPLAFIALVQSRNLGVFLFGSSLVAISAGPMWLAQGVRS